MDPLGMYQSPRGWRGWDALAFAYSPARLVVSVAHVKIVRRTLASVEIFDASKSVEKLV
jgi:hypothetical protein